MQINRDSAISLVVFFVLLIACTAIGYWLIFRLGRATPIMLAVGAATILTCLIRKRSLTTLGWGWGEWKYQWMSYLLPLLIVCVAYSIIWVAGFGDWFNSEFVAQQTQDYNLDGWSDTKVIVLHFLLTATYSFVLLLPGVLGEEMGWRGFLVPELARFMSFTGVALTMENESSDWYVGEFGAVPALVAFALALLFWRKGRLQRVNAIH